VSNTLAYHTKLRLLWGYKGPVSDIDGMKFYIKIRYGLKSWHKMARLVGIRAQTWTSLKAHFHWRSLSAIMSVISKVAGVKVYLRQTWNFRYHAVDACIGLRHQKPMYAPTACIAPWCHRLMHAVTEWALLFRFHLRYTFTSSYFEWYHHAMHRHLRKIDWLMARTACPVCLASTVSGHSKKP